MKKSNFISAIITFAFLYSTATPAENQSFLNNNKSKNNQDPSIFIQIFKQEAILELYQKMPSGQYKLAKTYPICKFSGGLGPKKIEGDLKSPEGFYQITTSQLNPNSRYYRSINIG
ncbi:MAG: L,D-transpeptidase family protein, partial [Providencia sp.]